MAEAFDPYHIWLAIPPRISLRTTIGCSAFRHSRPIPTCWRAPRTSDGACPLIPAGKHSADSQKLLNELAAARLCLLSSEKRQAYDRVLKAKLAAEKPEPPAPPSPAAPATKPLAKARPLAAQAVARCKNSSCSTSGCFGL